MKRRGGVLRILMLTCEESTRLVSESLDRELPRGERIAVRLHALICRSCRRLEVQLRSLRDVVRSGLPDDIDRASSDLALSPEARERIHAALEGD